VKGNELGGGIPWLRRPCAREANVDLKSDEDAQGGRGVVGNEDANLQAQSGSRQPPEGEHPRLSITLLKHNTIDPFLIPVVYPDLHKKRSRVVLEGVDSGNGVLRLALRLVVCERKQ
jgi:hypothetical protein